MISWKIYLLEFVLCCIRKTKFFLISIASQNEINFELEKSIFCENNYNTTGEKDFLCC